MNKKRLAAIGIIAGIILAVVLVLKFSGVRNSDELVLSGTVEVTEAHVGFKLPGRIIDLSVDEGQKVREGQQLAALDSTEQEQQVARETATLGESSVRLQELKTGSRRQEIEQAKAGLAAAGAELEKAKKDFERAEMLFKNGALSASQFDAAKNAFETRIAQHRTATETLSLVREGPRREAVSAAEQRMLQAKASLGASEDRLQDRLLFAPFNGVILRKNAEKGEIVAQGTPVFTIGDLERPWIKVYVKEDRSGLVKLGQKASVTIDTFPEKSYEGIVTFISSEAEFTPKNVQTQEERVKLVFGIKVSVKNQNDELKPGMPADVKILLK